MMLEEIVNKFFLKSSNFYDVNGLKVNNKEVKQFYINIKFHLYKNYNINDKVAVYVEKDYKYVILMLVCFELGLTFIPLNKKFPKNRIDDILRISDVNIIICDNKSIIFNNFNTLILSDIQNTDENIHISNIISEENIAYIIFTSGSTGTPKGVMIKRKSYVNFILWVDKYFNNIEEKDKLLNTADFTFDLSLIDIALLLSKNLHFYISEFNNNVFALMSEIEDYKITTMATVPNNFQMLLADGVYERGDLSSLKHLLIGGARFSYGLYEKFKNKLNYVNIYNLYGPTEATVYCSVKKINFNDADIHNENISVGKPINNCVLKLIDDNGNVIENKNTTGKLLVGGIQVMQGYTADKEKTKSVLSSLHNLSYYDTGDLAFFNEYNDFFIVGRSDDTIKVNGYRVNLSDIDSSIQRIKDIEECATISIKDEIKENILVSIIKLANDIKQNELYKKFNEILPSYQIPKKIIFVDNFPLNSSGKICKKTLKDNYL
jgi:amino acid adenylation domain-containing protein